MNNQLAESLEKRGFCLLENAITLEKLELIRSELDGIESEVISNGIDEKNQIIKLDKVRFMIHNLQFENCPEVHKCHYKWCWQ